MSSKLRETPYRKKLERDRRDTQGSPLASAHMCTHSCGHKHCVYLFIMYRGGVEQIQPDEVAGEEWVKKTMLGLERWFSSFEHLLPLKRAGVHFPAPTRWPPTESPTPRDAMAFSGLHRHAGMWCADTCRQTTHTHKTVNKYKHC